LGGPLRNPRSRFGRTQRSTNPAPFSTRPETRVNPSNGLASPA